MTETERRLRGLEANADQNAASLDRINGIDITEHIAPVYYKLHDDIQAGKYQVIKLPGGRGSGKSSFASLEIVKGIMSDATGKSNAVVFRKTASTLRESVFSQISWAIDTLNVGDLWKSSISPMCYTYTPTGAQIIFRGLDDPGKIKSIRPNRGYFKFIWIEEFSELPGQNFLRNIMQSVERGGTDFVIFYTFNPPISKSNWANLYVDEPDDRAAILRTTYLDMPAAWLGNSFINEAERLQEINPTAYQHEYLAIPTGTGGEVFQNITTREITDDEIKSFQYVYNGLDFGFSNDPTAFIRVAYDRKYETIYFLDEIYKLHCSNREIADEIKARGYDRTTAAEYLPIYGYMEYKRDRITCDSAEPKSIADLQSMGLHAVPCHKYPGCVLYRIKWLQHRQLVIDPKRTPHAYKEFINYEYMQTKDGEYLADVPDKDNHFIDGLSYALDAVINNRKEAA